MSAAMSAAIGLYGQVELEGARGRDVRVGAEAERCIDLEQLPEPAVVGVLRVVEARDLRRRVPVQRVLAVVVRLGELVADDRVVVGVDDLIGAVPDLDARHGGLLAAQNRAELAVEQRDLGFGEPVLEIGRRELRLDDRVVDDLGRLPRVCERPSADLGRERAHENHAEQDHGNEAGDGEPGQQTRLQAAPHAGWDNPHLRPSPRCIGATRRILSRACAG